MAGATGCPVCGGGLRGQPVYAGGRKTRFDCNTCGPFVLTFEATGLLRDDERQPLLSAWIRDHKERELEPPELSSALLGNIREWLPRYTVPEKLDLLLTAIARMTEVPGDEVPLDPPIDFPLAWAANEDEFAYLELALQRQGVISGPGIKLTNLHVVTVTPEGWKRIEALRATPLAVDQAFVAMRFTAEFKEAWDKGIKPAVEQAGYKPLRIDKEPHGNRIDAQIIAEIRNSRFVVADVSEQNPGVYFEAGFAMGLGRPVLWTCREDRKAGMHFDTRQFQHIIWKTPEELRKELYWLVCGVIGQRRRAT